MFAGSPGLPLPQYLTTLDKNHAAHYAVLDRLFGTDIKNPSRQFPEKYGVVGTYMPDGFLNQQSAPFRQLWKKATKKKVE